MGARPVDVLRTVVVPGALPYIFTGLQIAMGVAWFSLVAGDWRGRSSMNPLSSCSTNHSAASMH